MERAEATWTHSGGPECHRRGLIVAALTLAGITTELN
jgi:hypothetical protein